MSNDIMTFFQLFHISGGGNQSRGKELRLKMSCGRKSFWYGNYLMLKMSCSGTSCSKECLWVGNSMHPKMSLIGKYLAMENTSWWKMFGSPKSWRMCQKWQKIFQPSLLLQFIFSKKKDQNKRHEYILTFALTKVIVY